MKKLVSLFLMLNFISSYMQAAIAYRNLENNLQEVTHQGAELSAHVRGTNNFVPVLKHELEGTLHVGNEQYSSAAHGQLVWHNATALQVNLQGVQVNNHRFQELSLQDRYEISPMRINGKIVPYKLLVVLGASVTIATINAVLGRIFGSGTSYVIVNKSKEIQ